jgi:hypothetical protein
MRFFFGLHHPSDAKKFGAAFVSVNALAGKKSMRVTDWIMDSGAFTEISRHGHYRASVAEYAAKIAYWSTHTTGKLHAAVSQDYMCEPAILEKTGMTIEQHQALTIERYDALVRELRALGCDTYVMPVLQGYAPADYVRHLAMYGDRIEAGAWVGVGSVCKRNDDISAIVDVLGAISDAAPALRLHGFGLKTNALRSPVVRALLYTADSMAWSFQARVQGRDGNDPNEAAHWGRGFGVNRDGYTKETWRTIGVNEADTWQTPPPADWKPAQRRSRAA